MMNKPHKWAKEIKAWADGAEIEFSYLDNPWEVTSDPKWDEMAMEFRIKPQPKEPKYLYAFLNTHEGSTVIRSFKLGNTNEEYIGKIKLEQEDV